MAETFAIWKPKGISSFKALRAIKRANKGERVGHGGTLDPLAEGILVVAVGREATKKIHEAVGAEKEYIATISLGATSATDDAEGPITKHEVARIPTREELEQVVAKQVGEHMQVPPAFSAIHVAGKRAYELARKGSEMQLEPRPVMIKEAEVMEYVWPEAVVRYVTGPGVYIRALGRDVGKELRVGGYLTGLVRTRVGEFTKETARFIDRS